MILLILPLIDMCLSQSCGPRISPRLLMEIPCDMTKSSFCTLPGSAYPWSSVRRYIYENQGFMKRMYGEQRQSVILKEEIEELREKYDSIYYYGSGRGRGVYGNGHNGQPSFGPRSAFVDNNFQHTSSSTTVSLENNSGVERETNKTNQNQSLNSTNDTESKSLGREQIDEEHTYSMDNIQDDINLSTTTLNSNHENNDIPNVTPNIEFYISSVSNHPQTTTTTTTESSYSDEDTPEPKKGVNACPIKEEVIMPYWANNTRGETLALLNVYPFEQYIHWEKCAYENSQMFCRDGCRCEQQYRLHRLLAFDPKNDCRGIFADWFRFPGCCVCICYDLPESLRVNRRKARL